MDPLLTLLIGLLFSIHFRKVAAQAGDRAGPPRRESVNENLDAGDHVLPTASLAVDYFCSDDQGKFTYLSRVS